MPISAEFQQKYNQLNPAQKKAVDTIEGPVMVLAGPGTGKTQTLAMRIANILQQTQMDPWNILCLTFTESGVAAMRSRLLSIMGTPAYYVRIHTFHSFCNEILQEHPEIFAKGDSWRLIEEAEKIEYFQNIVDDLSAGSPLKPFYAPYTFFKDVMSAIGQLKQEDISPEALEEILKSLEVFFEKSGNIVEEFFTCTPKQRTHNMCESVRESVKMAFTESGVQKSIVYAVDQIFVGYEKSADASDSVREQSKARTVLKNGLKKWFVIEQKNLARNKDLARVYQEYENMLAKSGAYDYEDMIARCVAELRKNSELLADYQEQFQYVLVDEYQDTNGAQNEVVELLGSFDDAPNMFVVGDDKQSIYRFQGASLANMLSFYERYKNNVQIISLTENYRSQKVVIDSADALISHNAESLAEHIPGIIETLVPGKNLPEARIEVLEAQSEDEESFIIGQKIQTLIKDGTKPDDIAILYRYNKDGEVLLPTLRAMGIPARIEMGENIFESHEVRQWTTFITWLVRGVNEDDIARITQFSWWNIDAVDTLKAIHYAGKNYIPLFTVLASTEHLSKAEVRDTDAFLAFSKRLAEFRQASVTMPLMEFLETMLKEVHFATIALADPKSVEVLRAMKRLLAEAKQIAMRHVGYTISDFVQHLEFLQRHDVALLTPQWEGGAGAVHLMSAHKAKGLEWPHVFMIRMNDKHWGNPKKRTGIALPEGLVQYDFVFLNERNEDERRLAYVALTRAMLTCTLTRATHSATGKETVPSIFLSELPLEYIKQTSHSETEAMQQDRLLQTLIPQEVTTISSDARAYIKSLLNQYAMSVTHLNNYLECPQKFYWRNILQIPSMKTRSLMLGSAVHDTLRDVFDELKAGKSIPNASTLEKLFEKYLSREPMSKTDYKDIYATGSKALIGYVENYKDSFFTDVLTEHNFKKYHVMIGDASITGKLDKIEILNKEEKLVSVVDYKTGNSSNWREKLRKDGNYVRQMLFYKLLCDNAEQFPYTMQGGEFDFIEPFNNQYIKKSVELDDNALQELTETIVRVWKEIQELRFMNPENGCKEKDCEYCS
jgi:DNA helicase-2/ATP-dependent DNA helicase PcrA